MSKRYAGLIGSLLVGALCVMGATASVSAETLQSSSYKFDESTLGSGDLVQSNSAHYQSSNVLGDLAVGESSSASYQVMPASRNSADPTLSFVINNSATNFGSFSATSAATATASFSVSNYTSYGYVVQVAGSAPRNGSSTIPALATETSSQVGTKQFGMNLVANTSPVSVGANPSHGEFAVGSADPSYATPNKYRFVSGETIASAPSSSGVTTYTITYLVNVDSLTTGGKYTADQTLIVTGTY